MTARELGASGELRAPIVRPGERPALARQGRSWLLLRDEQTIHMLRFSGDVVTAELTLHRDGQTRSHAALATDGLVALVVYQRTTRDEPPGGVPRIYLTPVGPGGKQRAVRR